MKRAIVLLLTILSAKAAFAADAVRHNFDSELLAEINRYRAAHHLTKLAADDDMARLAKGHSDTMNRENRLSHDGFQDRFRESGRTECVENVGWNFQSPRQQFLGWKASPGHNRNMLMKGITRGGIARSGPYVTFFACN